MHLVVSVCVHMYVDKTDCLTKSSFICHFCRTHVESHYVKVRPSYAKNYLEYLQRFRVGRQVHVCLSKLCSVAFQTDDPFITSTVVSVGSC